MSMTQAPITITNSSYTTSAGYKVNTELARCANCYGEIERIAPNGTWGHMATGRAVCILPADATKVATPA